MLKAFRFGPDAASLFVAFQGGDVIRLDALTGREQKRFVADWRTPEQRQAKPRDFPQMWNGDFSADGRTLVESEAAFIHVWDVDTGKIRRTFRHPHEHGCVLHLAPDGKTLATSDLDYAGDEGEDTIRLFDIDTGDQVMTLDPGDNRANVLAFSPDGSKLFTGFHRGSAMVWDVRRPAGK
jgi:WD40 repeat protein